MDLALTALFGNERVVVCTSDLRQSKRGLVRSEGTSLFRFGAEGARVPLFLRVRGSGAKHSKHRLDC